ncbi:hypothetical protein F2P56_032419 [Juglans regia]|uniref:Reverse transcriptase domain-containing protein n=2 Tax=Juglans regia TaxID=51240 RepID=A0A833UA09_JUGRE|nr:uncharacterized protein LOC108998443 [Juglans regia]KAF5446820.1 hypothetical protein F2P56_032419 [Juglans regia]
MEDFNACIDNVGLSDMRYSGNRFSWCNGQEGTSRSWACLDRALISAEVISVFPEAHLEYLSRITSDHAPMVMRLKNPPSKYGSSPFKFQQMWVKHEAFMACVADVWEEEVEAIGMARLAIKLKKLKSRLRIWNREVFGSTLMNIKFLEERVEILEQKLQELFNDEDEQDYLVTNIELNSWKEREETRLRQQAKQYWLEKGEANASFFRAFNTQSKMQKQVGDLPDLSSMVNAVISDEDNESLCQLPSIQNVKDAVFSIPVDSSPGPDGFGSGFFQACWSIVWKDVVSHLAPMLKRIISPEQGAFIPSRSIFDNISLTQELANSINKQVRGGNIILKLDMEKAYDSVDWGFLLHVMAHFGFSRQMCGLIKQCISTPWFSVVMNGVPKGFFKSGRGLRQGDPISPYLFIIVEEILSRLLKVSFEERKIGFYLQPRGTPVISHLLYADDILVFANGSRKSVRAIRDTLSIHEQWSGQKIKNGNVSFWFDKWLDEGPLCSVIPMGDFPSLQVKDLKIENGWDVDMLSRLLGEELAEKVLEVLSKSREWADLLVWPENKDGKFSTKSAWNYVRVTASKVRWAEWVWLPCIPKNISVIMWKAFNNILSVDDKVRKLGIPIVSKCDCCLNGGYEDINHVLANGDIAKAVWNRVFVQIGLGRITGFSWQHLVEVWFTKASKASQMGQLLGIIPSIVTWSLRLRRCKARMDGVKDSAVTVWHNIKIWTVKMGEKL